MDYYLVMEGCFYHDSQLRKLTATNMPDAEKEVFVIALCNRRQYEIPVNIDFNNFNSWLLEWLGSDWINDRVEYLVENSKGYDSLEKCSEDTGISYDYGKVQNAKILEVNSFNTNVVDTVLKTEKFLKKIILEKAKLDVEKEERKKLADLKKKYGE